MDTRLITAVVLSSALLTGAAAEAGQRGRAVVIGRGVPRAVIAPRAGFAPRIIRPVVVGIAPFRPYYYRPRFGVSIYAGYPVGVYPYGYYGYGYPYGYSYPAYGYGYPAYGYGYPTTYGYGAVGARPYGGVRITDAPRDAQVFVDGYYVGIVDDFDGVFQHVNLEAGPHRIEIRAAGEPPVAFDVNVIPDRTITYRAHLP